MIDPRTCEFGDVYVDCSRMTVTRGGSPVDIEPKVFDVLPDGHRIVFERTIRRGSVWTAQVQ